MQHFDTVKTGSLAFLSWILSFVSWEIAGNVMGILVGVSSLVLTWSWVIYVRKKTYYLDQRNEKDPWA